MTGSVKSIPEGYSTITPHLVIRSAVEAIDFYKKAFGAEEIYRQMTPDGQAVLHTALKFGDSVLMLCDEFPEGDSHAPKSLNGTTVTMHLYVEDADRVFQRAIEAGCTASMPIMDAFWGDRYGKVKDPFGHVWSIATRIAEVSPEEIDRAAEAYFKKTEDFSI